jgi:hypothetical protein
VRLDYIDSEEASLIARLIGNLCRRNMSAAEKSKMLEELGKF